jgi:feruloyl esterase
MKIANCRYIVSAVSLAMCVSLAARSASAQITATGGTLQCSAALFSGQDVTITSAALIAASTTTVEECQVLGQVVTTVDGVADGSAKFELDLPTAWNGKLLFNGGGGFDGRASKPKPQQLAQGYATLSTDAGHTSTSAAGGAGWALTPTGGRDEITTADYLFRAIPNVNHKVRPLISEYYGQRVKRSYFMGCSNGGREAMFQAQKNPDDFDGWVAGDPSTQPPLGMHYIPRARAFLLGPIPFAQLPALGAAILAKCDAVDGVTDGLIQNPAACNFDPKSLVADGTLTEAQAVALTVYMSAIRDDHGEFVEPGFTQAGLEESSNLGLHETDPSPPFAPTQRSTPWAPGTEAPEFSFQEAVLRALVYLQPDLDILGPVVVDAHARLTHDSVGADAAWWTPGIAFPSGMEEVFNKNKKMIIYHGLSDADTPPYETQLFYNRLLKLRGSLERTKNNIRLFEVPDMDHCSGGTGPNTFDALTSLDNWVDKGMPPDEIIATKYVNNSTTQPVQRTMPLCPYPAIAHYNGSGDVNTASSWSCPSNDHTLFHPGLAGRLAGLRDVECSDNGRDDNSCDISSDEHR